MKSNEVKRFGIILVITGIVIAIPALWNWGLPDRYEATARIEINPQTDPRYFDLDLIRTEFEGPPSQALLSNVVAKLDLRTRWGGRYANGRKLEISETTDLLKRFLKLTPVPGTTFIDISVISEDFGESRSVVDTAAHFYSDPMRWWAKDGREKLWQDERELLEAGFEVADRNVQETQSELDKLKADASSEDAVEAFDAERSEAQRKLERFKRIRDAYVLKLSTGINLSGPSPVSLVKLFIADSGPIKPNRLSNLIRLNISAFLIFPGIFLAARRRKDTVHSSSAT